MQDETFSFEDPRTQPCSPTIQTFEIFEINDSEESQQSENLINSQSTEPIELLDLANQNLTFETQIHDNRNNNFQRRKLPEWFQVRSPETIESGILNIESRSHKKNLFIDLEETNLMQNEIIYHDVTHPKEIINQRVICFDLETTGFSRTDQIIEIGAIEYFDGKRTGLMFQSYIKPTIQINPFAFKVNQITNESLQTAPTIDFVLQNFLSWVGSSPLVAHNARFDMRMYGILNFLKFFDF